MVVDMKRMVPMSTRMDVGTKDFILDMGVVFLINFVISTFDCYLDDAVKRALYNKMNI